MIDAEGKIQACQPRGHPCRRDYPVEGAAGSICHGVAGDAAKTPIGRLSEGLATS
jgi:hypothetical protein